MIGRILERPTAVLVGAVSLVALGTVSLTRLPVSLLPTLERPRLAGSLELAGLSREEVLRRATRPLEQRLMAVPGVLRVETETREEGLRFRVETEWETDPDRFRIDVERRLTDVVDEGHLRLEMHAGDREPVVEVAVTGGTGGERTAFGEDVLRPELARQPQAGRVELLGTSPRHLVVVPLWAELSARGLSVRDLIDRLERIGQSIDLGRAREGGRARPLVLREEVESLEELRSLVVHGPGGGNLLGDLVRIEVREVENRDLYRMDGEAGILIRVFRAPGGNAVTLARKARRVVERLGAGRGRVGLRLELVEDRSREVLAALTELGMAAFGGFLLGTLFLGWMLGRWRLTLALALVIPASIVTSFAIFFAFGLSLDLVALVGLALAAGLLVDNSIVILESVERARNEDGPDAVERGVRRVALPVIAGVLTTAIVFVPLIYLEGLARAFFGVQAFVIVAALLVSLLFSFTVTPVLAGRRGAAEATGHHPGLGSYRRMLTTALGRPGVFLLGCGISTLLSLGILLSLPRELLPPEPGISLEVPYRLPPNLPPEDARASAGAWIAELVSELGEEVRWEWRQEPGAREHLTFVEEDGVLVLRYPSYEAAREGRQRLAEASLRSPEVVGTLRWRRGAVLQAVETLSGTVHVEGLAPTRARADALAERAGELLAGAGARVEREERRRDEPVWWLRPRAPDGAGELAESVRAALISRRVGRTTLLGVEPEILLEAPREDFRGLPLDEGLPLSARATLRPGGRRASLLRIDGRPARRLRVIPPPATDPLELTALLAEVSTGRGETLRAGGEALELSRSFRQLTFTLGLSALLVFLTLAALFESWRLPWFILATVPVALGGAGILLALTGQSLNLMSFLGLVVLVGIVVNNSIVLLHRAEEEAHRGRPRTAAALTAAGERYRPILLTTLTTVAGMVPLALLGGEGVALRRALATSVVGGLLAGVVASLLLVPVIYRFGGDD